MNKLKILASSIVAITLFTAFSKQEREPFVMLESHKLVIQKDTLAALEAVQPKAMESSSGKALVFPDSIVQLIVRTGPENDMLSYRIQGLRNPTLIVRAGVTLHVLFANVDDDMTHDFRLGSVKPPDTTGTVGTSPLNHSQDGTFSAEGLTFRALEPGKYSYFCSVRNHAANGMRGTLVVVKADMPLEDMKRMGMSKMSARHSNNSVSGEGIGTVRSIDFAHQTITLDHGNIPGVMPAMTMAYKAADPKFLQSVKVNESVRFSLTRAGDGEFLITEIQQQ